MLVINNIEKLEHNYSMSEYNKKYLGDGIYGLF